MNNTKLNVKPLPDAVINEIIAGSIEGVEPTTHEIAMALELRERRSLTRITIVAPTVTRWEELVTQQVPKQPADREKIGGCSWLDWNQLSAMGLLERINREILHPIGLAAYRNPQDGTSGGALVSPDGKWEYADDARLPSKSSEGGAS
ncbi:hypothetical protein [Kosakonia sp. MUSA4]|uniref:DUF7415 domain-containing protein n=1 Tax=Kosakonia sp. MUSA4 TaxID=2067958 RepID=UPI001599D08B|nr:hypothetical protein [Kosakonia sp. MUSA4]QJT79594.1 hypothetical protein C0557_05685 [Kosakonia sp. MUSA4]